VRWLREQAGVETIVILGNSGGASLMGAYQSRALDGNGLSPGDLFVSLCAHPGRPDVLTMWLDPSVVDETDVLTVDPSLDMFNPENGPPYSAEFVQRYRAAQVARNDRISAWCHEELDRLAAGGARDRLFTISRQWADLRFLDLSLDPSDRPVGCYFGDPKFANFSPFGLASSCTLRTWLDMWSLAESQCRATPHLGRITQAALVVQSTGDQGCFLSDAHAIHDQLGSTDKQLELVPGDHYLTQPEGARDSVADLIVDWVAKRS
jgi:pimeloyl-ACP methyl ester carboxylesterase